MDEKGGGKRQVLVGSVKASHWSALSCVRLIHDTEHLHGPHSISKMFHKNRINCFLRKLKIFIPKIQIPCFSIRGVCFNQFTSTQNIRVGFDYF